MLPDERPTPQQIAALRAMTPAERWRAATDVYWSARRMKVAFVRSQHPDWSDEAVEAHVRRLFLDARS